MRLRHAPDQFRAALPDFAGRTVTLSDHPSQWEETGSGPAVLLLGLGPGDPARLPFVAEAPAVFWLDHPACRPADAPPPPPHWREISPAAVPGLAPACRRFLHRPGPRLAPEFWGPILGRLDAADAAAAPSGASAPQPAPGAVPSLILPGNSGRLLHQDLLRAASGMRLRVLAVPAADRPPAHPLDRLPDLIRLTRGAPAVLLSVNLAGLDPDGRMAHACLAAGIAVAVWFVDNPWHTLGAARTPWWRECALFVTDAGFVPDLAAAGAKRAAFLPLAFAPHMRRPPGARSAPPLFVGRSAFPGRDRFFAAARVPDALREAALEMVRGGASPAPDFHWWRERLGAAPWPDNAIRNAGLGAEICSRERRACWLRAACATMDMRIIGDDGWKDILPGVPVSPPVDYYGSLPDLYGGARAVLNVTSLLLPGSLNQRHFDVWAAGGLLLSDPTPGLGIFPGELTAPIRLEHPGDLARVLEEREGDPAGTAALVAAWREEILARHAYARRLEEIFRICAGAEIR